MTTTTTVLVVGAGPTGLLAAAELRRRGVECLLIDAHESPMDWDRATVVHPRTLEILDALGIVEPLLSAGVKQKLARIHADGKLLGVIDLQLCGSRYPFNIGISEEVTEALLTDYLVEHGGHVARATKLVEMQERKDGVLATLEHRGATYQVLAEWVVGCDGYHSTVRRFSEIEQEGHDLTQPWAVFDAGVSHWADSFEGNYAYLDTVPVILTALPGERWRVYLRPSASDSDLPTDAMSTLGRYLPQARFTDVSHPTRFDCHSKVAKRFRAGRVLLAGDAAHTCSPAQGHGMNTGMQDAYNLGWKLALVCKGHCSAKLLDSYHDERRPVADRVIASGDAVETAQMLKGAKALHERDDAIRTAFSDAVSRHHEAVAEAELDIDYAASPIVLGDKHDAIWPGQRLSDQIRVHEANVPLHDDNVRPINAGSHKGMLHTHANSLGHTALLIADAAVTQEQLETLRRELQELCDGAIIEKIIAVASDDNVPGMDAYLEPAAAGKLGVTGTTLLAIRPDGHIGMRAEQRHAETLSAYVDLLRAVHS